MNARYAISDTLVLAMRSLRRIPRNPDLLTAYTLQPIMFTLLFVVVFGGAIATPGYDDYADFLIPGIIVQQMSFGGFATALGLVEDLKKGLVDRFRSLPMSRMAVLTGRTLSDIAMNALALTVMVIVGYIIGFSFTTSAPEVIGGIALCLLIGYTFSWVFACVGLYASTPEAANAFGFIAIFPLTFASSAFVPPETFPDWLQTFATDINPFSIMVDAVRALFVGSAAGNDIWGIGRLVRRPDRRLRDARGQAVSDRRPELALAKIRPDQDQHEADDRARSRALVEGDDPERERDDRRHVGDHRGATRADLGVEHREEDERRRGAEHGEDDDRDDRLGGDLRRGQVRERERGEHDRGDRERGGHDRPRVDAAETELEDHRPARVAGGGDEDRDRAEELLGIAGHVQCPRARRRRQSRRRVPTNRLPVTRSERSKRSARTATIRGTEAIRIAASDEETCCSPAAISGNGIAISATA